MSDESQEERSITTPAPPGRSLPQSGRGTSVTLTFGHEHQASEAQQYVSLALLSGQGSPQSPSSQQYGLVPLSGLAGPNVPVSSFQPLPDPSHLHPAGHLQIPSPPHPTPYLQGFPPQHALASSPPSRFLSWAPVPDSQRSFSETSISFPNVPQLISQRTLSSEQISYPPHWYQSPAYQQHEQQRQQTQQKELELEQQTYLAQQQQQSQQYTYHQSPVIQDPGSMPYLHVSPPPPPQLTPAYPPSVHQQRPSQTFSSVPPPLHLVTAPPSFPPPAVSVESVMLSPGLTGSPVYYSSTENILSQDVAVTGHRYERDAGTSSSTDWFMEGAVGESHASHLRSDAEEFVPHQMQRQQHRTERQPEQPHHQQQQRSFQRRRKRTSLRYSRPKTVQAADPRLHDVKQQLRDYTLMTLSTSFDPKDPDAIEEVMANVTRVPAVCFNEQKLENKESYQILLVPQSPAVRGQEALSRVCFALEQCLRQRSKGAVIISDYKFKENYLRNAPPGILDLLPRPEVEGSHDILMIGLEIGIVCIQVTCIEASTNRGTVKKQVRDSLKQLQKDVTVVNQVLQDLDIDDSCIHKVMALPNITTERLKEKLEPRSLKALSDALDTTEDLESFLTADRLPSVGHRHWSSGESRDGLQQWFTRLVERGATLSVEDYMQIFARYTCGWSAVEVWGLVKPRVQIRVLAHAVAETFRRYHQPVLTPEQDELLNSERSHVWVQSSPGCGTTCLLQLRAEMELQRGSVVLILIPRQLTGLRREYEDFAKSKQHSKQVYFWSGGEESRGISKRRFTSVVGDTKTLDVLRKEKKRIFALFDRVNRDEDLRLVVQRVTDMVTSLWVVTDAPRGPGLPLPRNRYYPAQFSSLTRVPTSVQMLVKHGLQEEENKSSPTTASKPSVSVSLPRDAQNIAEASSYLGLSTDGPSPLFIWHPSEASTFRKRGICGCDLCMNRFGTALKNLLGESHSQDSASQKRKAETTASGVQQSLSARSSPSKQSDTTDTHARSTTVVAEEDKQTVGEISLDINSGNVPEPLTASDVIIFVDNREDVVAVGEKLDLFYVEGVVQPLENLPHFIGTEKAVVGYVGKVTASAGAHTVMHALISRLFDVLTLCQGQLILALEFTSTPDKPPASIRGKQLDPYQLDVEYMLEQARKQHTNHTK